MSRGGVALAAGLVVVIDLLAATRLAGRLAPRMSRGRDDVVRSPLAWVLRMMIAFYRAVWSPRSAGLCRFEPSCSAYGLEAVRRYGGVRGGLLAAWRLLRCQPLSAGGHDPVPVRADIPPGRPGRFGGPAGERGVPAGEQAAQAVAAGARQRLDPHPNSPEPTASRCGTRV
ncbi:membrane protein insertion efficiency factor YidD [Protofrankia coriariae]|uniref:membrane protein insertion efficiency factor YidD n=1 Tax=Protofrankia coriariae TaxID=1562887 RepID=UPI000A32143E|nr:membrane protein insertion efficiency factor YidD [Protofrankia coriariae]